VLLVLMGLPGAGKSTLARAVCRAVGFARVDRDAFPRARFTPAAKARATARAWREARRRLARRQHVVLDGMTFGSRAQRRQARRLARACGARCVEIWLDCPPALAQQRVRATRDHPARDRTPALVREVAARFAPVPRQTPRIDARLPPRAQLRLLRRLLRRR
jgi:predicted kinase